MKDTASTFTTNEESEDEEEEEEILPLQMPAVVFSALADVRCYVSSMPGISDDAIKKINELETLIFNRFKKLKQNIIENYFKRL